MQHLDEGRLQAWLDRSRSGMDEAEREAIERHLADCAACRSRLAELGGLTTRVESLLSAPTGSQEIPAWEAVVARAQSHPQAAHAPRGRPVWKSVGWAAGIAAIMGAGWLSNDLFRRVETARSVAPSAATEVAPAPARMAEESAADEAGPSVGTPSDAGSRTAAATSAEEPRAEAKAESPLPAEARTAQVAEALPDLPRPATPVVPAPQPGVVAPTTAEEAPPPPSFRLARDRVAAAPTSSLLRGRVTDEAGQPLASAQVSIRGTNVGTLTSQDGAFALALPDTAPTSEGRDVTLTAQLLGYGPASRDVVVRAGDTVSAELRLSPQALALDEMVVTGALPKTGDMAPKDAATGAASARAFRDRRQPESELPTFLPGTWTSVERADAALRVGFLLRTVAELPVLDIAVGLVEGTPAVRIVQELDGGGRLTLFEAKGIAPFRDQPSADGVTWSVASTQRGDVWITATAPIPVDSLNALLERVR